MDFDEYRNTLWLKEHPLASLAAKMDSGNETEIDTYCLQRINWIKYCIDHNCAEEIDNVVIDELFALIIKYFEMQAVSETTSRDCFLAPSTSFQSLFEICQESFSFTKEQLEKKDDQLLDKMIDVFNKIYKDKPFSFNSVLKKVHSWFVFRQFFCNKVKIGFSPSEYYIPYNFYQAFREEMLELRNTDFDATSDFAEYALWLYGNAKTIPRQSMIGDLINFHTFAIQCCRNALVAAQLNGYFEYIESIKNRIRKIQSDIVSTPTIFISYKWSKEELVDEIQKSIGKFAIIKRDKNELKFGDSITEFMNTIRQEDFALIVVSDEYLKSDACMYELTTLFKDQGAENFSKKVLFLICDDALSIYSTDGRSTYVEFWDNKYKELITRRDQLTPESSVEITQSIRTVSFVRLQIGEFLEYIKDVNNFGEKNAIQTISEFVSKIHCEGKIGRNPVEDFYLYMKSRSLDTE